METTVTAVVSAPIITGLVQVFKPLINNSKVYAPLALVLGIVLNVAVAFGRHNDPIEAAFQGTIAGLAAAGIFSATKAATE